MLCHQERQTFELAKLRQKITAAAHIVDTDATRYICSDPINLIEC